MKINVDIERLVIEGGVLERSLAPLLGQALQAELTRLLAEQGTPPRLLSGSAVPVLQTEPVSQSQTTSPAERGTQIAQAVYGAIQK